MNSGRVLIAGISVWLGLCLPSSARAGDAKPKKPARDKTAQPIPQKRSVSIPVSIPAMAGKPASMNQCLIAAGPAVPVSALAFSPDGKWLAVGGYQEIVVWDLDKARLDRRIGAGKLGGQVRALVFSKDGRFLAAADGTPGVAGTARILEWESGRAAAEFEPSKDEILALAFSPDGKLLAAGGNDAVVRVWNVETKQAVTTLKEHGDAVQAVAFSTDGKLLATASGDRTVRIYDPETWKPVVQLPQQMTAGMNGLSFSPDGEFLAMAVGGLEERAIRLWRTENSRTPAQETDAARTRRMTLILQTRPLDTGVCTPLGVTFAPPMAGAPARLAVRMYVPCADKTVRVMTPAAGFIANLSGHTDWVYAVAASPDGRKIASGSGDGTVKLWNGLDNTLIATILQLSPRTDEWVIITPRGYFAASSTGALQWKTADPKDDLTKRLQNPEVVRNALAIKVAPPQVKK